MPALLQTTSQGIAMQTYSAVSEQMNHIFVLLIESTVNLVVSVVQMTTAGYTWLQWKGQNMTISMEISLMYVKPHIRHLSFFTHTHAHTGLQPWEGVHCHTGTSPWHCGWLLAACLGLQCSDSGDADQPHGEDESEVYPVLAWHWLTAVRQHQRHSHQYHTAGRLYHPPLPDQRCELQEMTFRGIVYLMMHETEIH